MKRVFVQFSFRQGWFCEFLEEDRKTRPPRTVMLADERKLFELVKRAGFTLNISGRQEMATASELVSPWDRSSLCSDCRRGAESVCCSTLTNTPESRPKSREAFSEPYKTSSIKFLKRYLNNASTTSITISGVAIPK